jgi:hypothetical protein
MKYLRRTARYTLLNLKRNEEILEELHVTPLEHKLCTYRHKWFQHVHRMEDNRLPKQLLNYHPKGRRRPGRPRKRLLEDVTAETETGHRGLIPWWNVMKLFRKLHEAMSFLWNWQYAKIVKKLPACYRTRRFITMIKKARHLSLSRGRWSLPTPLPKEPF